MRPVHLQLLEGGKQFHRVKLSKRESQYLKHAYNKDNGIHDGIVFDDSRAVISLLEKRIFLQTEEGFKLHEMAKAVFLDRGILDEAPAIRRAV
jgi:hypothetical protein